MKVLDIGSMGVNGSGAGTFRELFEFPGATYVGLDIAAGPNVDVVPKDPYAWAELSDDSFDVVISGQALEHVEFPWLVMEQIQRKLKTGGLGCLIVPSRGPIHRYPVDCYRYYPDGLRALAKWAGLTVLEVDLQTRPTGFDDGSDQWGDCHCVLMKTTGLHEPVAPTWTRPPPQGDRAAHRASPLVRLAGQQTTRPVLKEALNAIDKHGVRAARALEVAGSVSMTSQLLRQMLAATSYEGLTLPGFTTEAAGMFFDRAGRLDPALLDAAELQRLGYEPGSCDALVMLDVVEQLVDPWDALLQLAQVVKPGGHVLLSAGNVQHSSVMLGLVGGTFSYEAGGPLQVSKLRFFTLSSLTELVTGAGLRVVDTTAVIAPPIDMSKVLDVGNAWCHGKLALTKLTRDDVIRLFSERYVILAQRE